MKTKQARCWMLVLLLALGCSFGSGCGLITTVQYWMYGYKVDPKFTGLENKKVAVVCVSGANVLPTGDAMLIANTVGTILGHELKGCEVISQQKIADWMDKNDWDQVDYEVIGKGVEADMLIGVDLESFTIHEGQTLLKGRADVRVRVLDMERDGDVVYGPVEKHSIFPKNAAQHVTENNELNFRKLFIYTVSQEIARDFYPYDRVEDIAQDSAIHSN